MKKTHPLGFRVPQEIKEGLIRAAEADERSVSSLIERILKHWLIENGFLKKVSSREISKLTNEDKTNHQ